MSSRITRRSQQTAASSMERRDSSLESRGEARRATRRTTRSTTRPSDGSSSRSSQMPSSRRSSVEEDPEETESEEEREPTLNEFMRRHKAKGKRPAVVVEQEESEEESEEGSEEEELEEDGEAESCGLSKRQLYDAFMRMEFLGTRYPHKETMEKLAIEEDVEYLFEKSNLTKFMGLCMEGYKEESCEFLATVKLHTYARKSAEAGAGHITFTIKGKRYELTMKKIANAFGFEVGSHRSLMIPREELYAVWETIGDNKLYSSSNSKSSRIRSPVLRYFHKALANTFFARKETGNINEGELKVIDLALNGVIFQARNGTIILGSTVETDLAMVLIDNMIQLRSWVGKLENKGSRGGLTIGGIITPILQAAKVPLRGECVAPRWIDSSYLTSTLILAKEMHQGNHIFNFELPTLGKKQLILPNQELTTIQEGANIDFWPAEENWFDGVIQPRVEEAGNAQEAVGEEQFYFEDYEVNPRDSRGVRETTKRLTLLQKWNKWHGKRFDKLKKKVTNMAKSIKGLKKEIAELKSGNSSPSHSSPLRRSSSTRALTRVANPMEPARASMYEPNQRKRSSSTREQPFSRRSTGSLEHPLDRAPPMHSAEYQPRSPYGFPPPAAYPGYPGYPPIPPQYFMDPALYQQFYQQQAPNFETRGPARPPHSDTHSTESGSIPIVELPHSPSTSHQQDTHYSYDSMQEDVDNFFHNP